MIDNDLYKVMSESEVPTFNDLATMDYVLNLEILNGCAHHCDGCFVRRKNAVADDDLSVALELAQQMDKEGLRFREVILSPTDIFSAVNAVEVLSDPKFQELLRIHPKTRITTTAMFENINWDNFFAVFDILDNSDFYRDNMILEFLVPMNPEKMLSGDKQYYADFKKAIRFLENETPKEVDWSLVVNVHYDPLLLTHYDELAKIAREEFNTIIEFLPSFFRTGKDLLIKNHLEIWRKFLRTAVNEDNYKEIMLTVADRYHNSFNTIVTNYRKGKLFISPFIYEQILTEYPNLEVTRVNAPAVLKRSRELIGQQYAYAELTDDCSSCDYLNTCVGRNVLSFMEIKNIKECVYPKDVLDMYHRNGTNALSPRITRCQNNIKE